jgi:hypothetical protein
MIINYFRKAMLSWMERHTISKKHNRNSKEGQSRNQGSPNFQRILRKCTKVGIAEASESGEA